MDDHRYDPIVAMKWRPSLVHKLLQYFNIKCFIFPENMFLAVFVHKNKKDSLDTSSSKLYGSIKYCKGVG